MQINNKFDIGDVVYVKTDPDQSERIVISIQVFKNGELLYKVSFIDKSEYFYDFELSTEKDILKTLK